jgi:ribosomal protein S18 acetylase RimI-like enzyme
MEITQLHVQIDSTKQTDVHLFAKADDHAGPVGMLVLGLEDGENSGWISRVFVHPDYRRRGVAKELLSWAITICQQKQRAFVSLTVSNENPQAQLLYLSLGFVPFMNGRDGYTQYIKTL